MAVTLGQQYNIGEKPTVILYTYMQGHQKNRGNKKCSFQKEGVVCEWRIGIRKSGGNVILLSPPRGAGVQFNLPGKQAREE